MHPDPSTPALPADADWWRDAVIYQIYIRSFADGNGDGVGDLAGIRSRLPYLADLGVDGVWITPFYPSPMADHGYDVADPRDVEPVFGDLAEFDALLADAHALGLRVTVDLVPNHTSDQHEWFRAALAAPPGSAERARYLFRDGRGPDGERAAEQLAVGLRRAGLDAACPTGSGTCTCSRPSSRTWTSPTRRSSPTSRRRCGSGWTAASTASGSTSPTAWPSPTGCRTCCRWTTPACSPTTAPGDHRFDQDGVHAVHRRIRAVLDEYPGRMAVGEVWVSDDARLAQYLRDGRAPARLQLQAADRGLDAGRAARRGHPLAGRRGGDAGAGVLGAVQPRPPAARDPLRRGRGRAPAGAGGGAAAAGPAGRGLPLQRRRAGPARRRPARRGAAGPGVGAVGAHRAGPGRLPGAGAVVGQRAPVRVLLRARHLAADAGGLGRADRGGAGGRSVVDAVAVPIGAGPAAVVAGLLGRTWSGCRRPRAASPSAARAAWRAW